MSIGEFLILLLIAGICGSVAQGLVGYSHGGCLVSIVLGLIGAMFGGWIARKVGVGDILSIAIGDQTYPVVWSIVGAVIFVALLSLLTRRAPPID